MGGGIVALCIGAGLLAGCGSDGSANGSKVASVGTSPDDPDGSGPDGTDPKQDPQEAMLAYTECMRDHGIDMPDPVMAGSTQGGSKGGGPVIEVHSAGSVPDGADGPAFNLDDKEFKEASAACDSLLDDVIGQIDIDPEQEAEMRQQLLDYSQCMRDQGIDFPDPVFNDNGGVSINVSGGEGNGPSKIDDEKMQAASEACSDILGDGGAFTVGQAVGS